MFAVGKASDENMERNEINRIKYELKEKLGNQSFRLIDIKHLYPGKSELTLLTESTYLEQVHVNLIYAFIELYREAQIDIVSRDPLSFWIEG